MLFFTDEETQYVSAECSRLLPRGHLSKDTHQEDQGYLLFTFERFPVCIVKDRGWIERDGVKVNDVELYFVYEYYDSMGNLVYGPYQTLVEAVFSVLACATAQLPPFLANDLYFEPDKSVIRH